MKFALSNPCRFTGDYRAAGFVIIISINFYLSDIQRKKSSGFSVFLGMNIASIYQTDDSLAVPLY